MSCPTINNSVHHKDSVVMFVTISWEMEHVLTDGRMCRRIDGGRQGCVEGQVEGEKEITVDSLLLWHGVVSAHTLIRAVGDCKLWSSMVSNASQQDT